MTAVTALQRWLCARCRELKEADFFYVARPRRDQRACARPVMYWCIKCCRAYKASPRNQAYDRARSARRRKTVAA